MNTRLSKYSALFLAIVLVAGTISTMIPVTTFAQPYSDQQEKQQKYYPKDPYAKKGQQKSWTEIQKINCINSDVNINGIA